MSKKSKRTTTVTLSVNINNVKEYRFTVDIGRHITRYQAKEELIGKNCFGEEFRLCGLGPAVMDLLVQLGHATKYPDFDDWGVGTSRSIDRYRFIEVLKYRIREDDPSAEVSLPAIEEAAPDGQVIQVEPSHKAI